MQILIKGHIASLRIFRSRSCIFLRYIGVFFIVVGSMTMSEHLWSFLHGSCVAHHKGSFNFKVSASFSVAKQLLKESHKEEHQQKPPCLWLTLNEQNTLMAKFTFPDYCCSSYSFAITAVCVRNAVCT